MANVNEPNVDKMAKQLAPDGSKAITSYTGTLSPSSTPKAAKETEKGKEGGVEK